MLWCYVEVVFCVIENLLVIVIILIIVVLISGESKNRKCKSKIGVRTVYCVKKSVFVVTADLLSLSSFAVFSLTASMCELSQLSASLSIRCSRHSLTLSISVVSAATVSRHCHWRCSVRVWFSLLWVTNCERRQRCVCQGTLSLRQQNMESLLDYLHSTASLVSRLSNVEETALSQGWSATLTQLDDMTHFHQVLTVQQHTAWLTVHSTTIRSIRSIYYLRCIDNSLLRVLVRSASDYRS